MPSTPTLIERRFLERAKRTPLPDWVQRMIEQYRKTGTYRTEDLRRLLGDPTKGIEFGSRSSLAALYAEFTKQT